MEINEGLRQRHDGVDAGPWLGNIMDMEYGDDEMLLGETPMKAKRLVENWAELATMRGMGVQAKKTLGRKWGVAYTPKTKIHLDGTEIQFISEVALYLGCLSAPCLSATILHRYLTHFREYPSTQVPCEYSSSTLRASNVSINADSPRL